MNGPERQPSPSPPPADDATQDVQQTTARAERIVRVLDQYMADLKAGAGPHRHELLAAHPDLAEQLEACLAGIEFIHGGDRDHAPPQRLGDFRILREIGRGGMGAVYEAEQVSLGRRVALKVLRFGTISDREALQRFQREAETVARLHHTNIVPIFAVGNEAGVNYYAMQFIEGRSLDRVLQESDGPLPPATVARWGLQAAEALAHAHARGVIHRDVKPSNLLLDAEGRIWLTDFGLAKRSDDVTLSMTGALLGTPRYMSPEQASAASRTLDHRTDIYSLGASLYELATGQPVFTSDTPHALIGQILSEDPVPPRRHRPDLPRDLETILVKCLAKEPAARYGSARQVVDDLRALEEGRPISARRAGGLERAARWLKRQRRSAALTAAAVAATMLLVLLAAGGGSVWHRLRLAYLTLDSARPPLIAQLLDPQGRPVAAATVPTQQPLEVPAGEYRLRLAGDVRLSQEFDLSLGRRVRQEHKLDLDAQLLWDELPLERTYRLWDFQQSKPPSRRTDVLVLDESGLECRDGRSGERRWTLTLRHIASSPPADGPQLLWPWNRSGQGGFRHGLGVFDGRPFVVPAPEDPAASGNSARPVFDLDGDGAGDLVLALRDQLRMVAVSGHDGRRLWTTGDPAVSAEEIERRSYWQESGGVVQPPLLVGDQDGDGRPDVLASLIRVHQSPALVERWLELFSGASGKSLWRFDLPAELFELPAGEETPYDLRWFYSASGGSSSDGSSRMFEGTFYSRRRGSLTRSGPHAYLPTDAMLVPGGWASHGDAPAVDQSVLLVAGTRLLVLDVATGTPAGSQELGCRPGLQPRLDDLDGDGHTDLLLTCGAPPSGPAGRDAIRLAAWSPARAAMLWECEVQAAWPQQLLSTLNPPAWPLIADLDGDGAGEILVPDGNPAGPIPAAPGGGIAVLDGRTGQSRWQTRLRNLDHQLDHFLPGPDIDGDGVREVYVASLWGADLVLMIDCLSGRDGRTMWRTQQPLPQRESQTIEYRLAELGWHVDGGDGWPQLSVSARVPDRDRNGADCTLLFSAGTGQMMHLAAGASQVHSIDLDGDRALDLLLFQRSSDFWDRGGRLAAVRGVGREPWRRVGPPAKVGPDLDGDGVRDLIDDSHWRQLEVRSGATGRLLWRSELDVMPGRNLVAAAAAEFDPRCELLPATHDLNGDGTPDVLVASHSGGATFLQPVMWAVSGATGRRLWESELSSRVVQGTALLECRDLDGDGHVEIILAAGLDDDLGAPGPGVPSFEAAPRLVVISGRDGRTRWQQPLTQPVADGGTAELRSLERVWLEAAYADLDGDGVLDLVLPGERKETTGLEMRAFGGADGRCLWRFALPAGQELRDAFGNLAPAAAGDLDGDGRTEVVVLTLDQGRDPQGLPAHTAGLHVLDGRTGQLRWQWQTPRDVQWGTVGGQVDRVKRRARPLLLRRSDGQQWIALLTKQNEHHVWIFEAGGQVIAEAGFVPRFAFGDVQLRLWALDADSDGNDELLVTEAGSLRLLEPDRLEAPLWQRPPDATFMENVIGILPDSAAAGRVVVAGRYGDYSFVGLDPATGREVWRCVSPQSRPGGALRPLNEDEVGLLNGPQGDLPPHVRYRAGIVSLCRAGIVDRDGLAGAADQPPALTRAAPVLSPAAPDPRMLRPLPWKPNPWELEMRSRFFAWAAFYGLTLAAVPTGYAVWLIRRRQWGLRTVLLLPVVAAIALLGVINDGPDSDFRHLPSKLVIAFAGAGPVLLVATVVIWWAWRRRWLAVGGWLAAGLAIAAGMAAFSLVVTGPARGGVLEPGESWSWSGWFWIAPPAYVILAWATLLLLPPGWLLRKLWRRRVAR